MTEVVRYGPVENAALFGNPFDAVSSLIGSTQDIEVKTSSSLEFKIFPWQQDGWLYECPV